MNDFVCLNILMIFVMQKCLKKPRGISFEILDDDTWIRGYPGSPNTNSGVFGARDPWYIVDVLPREIHASKYM